MKNLRIDPVTTGSNKILFIGIGNCGLGDDGLGWKITDMLKRYSFDFMDYEYRYQLQIEDAMLISAYDTVIFADASHTELEHGFEIKSCAAANHYFFSSHIQSPETILYLANSLYNKHPKAYTLAIAGYSWELETSLSRNAGENLESAFIVFTKNFLPTVENKLIV